MKTSKAVEECILVADVVRGVHHAQSRFYDYYSPIVYGKLVKHLPEHHANILLENILKSAIMSLNDYDGDGLLRWVLGKMNLFFFEFIDGTQIMNNDRSKLIALGARENRFIIDIVFEVFKDGSDEQAWHILKIFRDELERKAKDQLKDDTKAVDLVGAATKYWFEHRKEMEMGQYFKEYMYDHIMLYCEKFNSDEEKSIGVPPLRIEGNG